MTTNFHVGQKVVCIRPTRKAPRELVTEAVVGVTYTIRGITTDIHGDVGLVFVEIVNRPRTIISMEDGILREPAHYAERFRPVVERKTDISIFKAILENPRIPIEA